MSCLTRSRAYIAVSLLSTGASNPSPHPALLTAHAFRDSLLRCSLAVPRLAQESEVAFARVIRNQKIGTSRTFRSIQPRDWAVTNRIETQSDIWRWISLRWTRDGFSNHDFASLRLECDVLRAGRVWNKGNLRSKFCRSLTSQNFHRKSCEPVYKCFEKVSKCLCQVCWMRSAAIPNALQCSSGLWLMKLLWEEKFLVNNRKFFIIHRS